MTHSIGSMCWRMDVDRDSARRNVLKWWNYQSPQPPQARNPHPPHMMLSFLMILIYLEQFGECIVQCFSFYTLALVINLQDCTFINEWLVQTKMCCTVSDFVTHTKALFSQQHLEQIGSQLRTTLRTQLWKIKYIRFLRKTGFSGVNLICMAIA